MSAQDPEHNEMISWRDIEFVYYRHRTLIRWSSLLGVLGALIYLLAWPAPYESQSKLLVRYVLDRSMVDPQESKVRVPDATYNENLITAEKEILASGDLSFQVAQELLAEPLLQGRNVELQNLARQIASGLAITGSKGSNVITVAYKASEPLVAQRTLEILINKYFTKHLEVHRSANAFDYVSHETSLVQSRLKNIEEDLKKARVNTGIISLKDSAENLEQQLAKSRESVNSAEEELVAQQARVKELEKLLGAFVPTQQGTPPALSRKEIRSYQSLSFGVASLRQKQLDLLTRYTPESQVVKATREQIGALESQQHELEQKYPALTQMAQDKPGGFRSADRDPQLELITERATLAALEEKAGILRSQLNTILEQARNFAEIAPHISYLEQQRELESTNFKYFQESLDKARIDEALDPSKIPNISIVQKPTKAEKAAGNRIKILLGIGLSGMILGVGYSALKEGVLDRTVKRPTDLKGIPILLTIPRFSGNKSLQESQLYEYAYALKERLILDLQRNSNAEKPKVIGCTACSIGSGTTTISEALARVLSKSANVLFLTIESTASRPPDIEWLQKSMRNAAQNKPRSITVAALNLGAPFGDGNEIAELRDVICDLRASHFDYVLLDLPPLGPTSPGSTIAPYVDKLLCMVEAEVSRKDAVECNFKDLNEQKANVAAVINKYINYGPEGVGLHS